MISSLSLLRLLLKVLDLRIQNENDIGWVKIIMTSILLHSSQEIAPRVTSQAKGQNDILVKRALKCGIVRLCNSNSTGDMIKKRKYQFLKFFV